MYGFCSFHSGKYLVVGPRGYAPFCLVTTDILE